ncbi:MAG: endonuclease/exonuclease/phosphatase family protein [Chloroflexota bacterium]
MTFNIWWRSQSSITGRIPLDQGIPDVVALQELTPHMANCIEEHIGEHYPHRSIITSEEPTSPRLGIYSKFPLEDLNAVHLSSKDFRVQIVRINLLGESITLYNIHPRATNLLRYWQQGGSLSAQVHHSFRQREEFIRSLLDDIVGRRDPVIVVGDFNSTPLSDVYRLMRSQLEDAHRVAGRGWGYTFPNHGADFARLPLRWPFMRLDMIFCSPNVTVYSCGVGQKYGESDHRLVIAQFGV